MSAKPKIAPTRRQKKSRRYHLADDAECVFDYEAPEWLIGG